MTHAAAPHRSARPWLAAATCVAGCVALTGGCSSVITSAYLREAWLDAVEHAADGDDADDAPRSRRRPPAPGDAATQDPPPAPLSLAEAVAAAETRLADAGGLSDAARGTLITMLEATPPQDWPVVVEEFAAALAAGSGSADQPSPPPRDDVARDALTPPPASPPAPSEPPAPEPPLVAASAPPAAEIVAAVAGPVSSAASSVTSSGTSAAPASPTTAPDASPPPPALALVNACFASRVRAWGVVDRFESSRFRSGQQVILYFEIENLSSRQSADGHSTRVDTRLVLLAADGTRLHEWTFDPLEETCLSKRRDYFARYVLELPAGLPPGPCRLEVAAEDALAGGTAATTLPLEIVRR